MKSRLSPNRPPFRKLRGYAFDPVTSLDLNTADINQIGYKISWENDLQPGPEGEYIKVVDRDPSSNVVYRPVDLNELAIVASEGLDPNEGNPQFHQQMVYAVTMNTIKNFEKAIGRKVQWSPSVEDISNVARYEKRKYPKKRLHTRRYIGKLLIYPHAFRGANAYYSSDRKAVLFGYFNATPASADLHMPGSIVYSCLSHDIIAHEITHAILDGMFNRYMESTHPDVGAFHEAFADIVALFQHFSFSEVITHEIAKIRGRFDAETLLGKLAVEFGKASGGNSSLRDAIGMIKEEVNNNVKTKSWSRNQPNTQDYSSTFECHDRGAILVGAVFDAFIEIYHRRAAEVIKIATGGTGQLPAGELSTQLVNSLAAEASKAASHVLSMCIRALDYCPPVDINFGDYLRALITADKELVSDDKHNYRVAFIDAFRKRGIYPEGINSLSIESLTYTADDDEELFRNFSESLTDFLREFKNEMSYIDDRRAIFNKTRAYIVGNIRWLSDRSNQRKGVYDHFIEAIGKDAKKALLFEKLTGLVFSENFKSMNIYPSGNVRHSNRPSLEIHDIRLNNRVSPDGHIQNQVIIILAQSCGVRVKEKDGDYEVETFLHNDVDDFGDGAFLFRGGCTLVFDLDKGGDEEAEAKLKYVISKPILDMELLRKRKPQYAPNKARAIMQYRCLYGDYSEITGIAALKDKIEHLAHIHHSNQAAL